MKRPQERYKIETSLYELHKDLQIYNQSLELELLEKNGVNYDLDKICELHEKILSTYERLKDYDSILSRALEFLNQIKSVAKDPSTHLLRVLNNVALGYDLCENYTKSIECRQSALDMYPKLFDDYENRSSYASCLDNIGITHGSIGNHDKSFEFHHKALEIRVKLPEDTKGKEKLVATSLNNLGDALLSLNRYEEALELEQMALEKFDRLREVSYESSVVKANIGKIFDKQGKHGKALEYHKQSLDIKQQCLEENDLQLAYGFSDIGYTYGASCRHKESLESYTKALEIFESVLGPYKPSTLMTLLNIASELCFLTRHHDEILYFKEYLQRYDFTLKNNPDMVMPTRLSSIYEVLKNLYCSETDGDDAYKEYEGLNGYGGYECIMGIKEISNLFGEQAPEADLSQSI